LVTSAKVKYRKYMKLEKQKVTTDVICWCDIDIRSGRAELNGEMAAFIPVGEF